MPSDMNGITAVNGTSNGVTAAVNGAKNGVNGHAAHAPAHPAFDAIPDVIRAFGMPSVPKPAARRKQRQRTIH